MNVIEIQGLSKVFTGKRLSRVEALKGLDLTVGAGEVFGFLGPNGAGKSTTIKLMMGLLRPAAGSASIMGIDARNPASRRNVGYLPENPAFYDYLSAEEYISFVGSQFGMAPADLARRSEEVLKLLELWDARKRPMRGYSKGMVQRVGLAQALVHDPDLYVLDEPMSGLDPIGRALVKNIILDLKKRGKCVFFSTHITDDVEKICDRLGIIVKGKLVALDRVENVLKSGIEGYTVEVSGATGEALSRFELRRAQGERREYHVARESFDAFVEAVGQAGGKLELIETERKGLEEFMLELVRQESGQ